MKAVIHKTGAIGEVLGIERRDDGNDYVYFQNGLCKPISEVGFLNPYEQYEEDCYDWADFRREAAKDILCALLGRVERFYTSIKYADSSKPISDHRDFIRIAIEDADELIKQLKEYEQRENR